MIWIEAALASSLKVLVGWLLALILGFVLAAIRYCLPEKIQKNYLFNLVLDLIKYPPPIAWVPVVIIFFGISFFSSVLIVIIGSMPPFFSALYDLFQNTPSIYKNFSSSMQFNKIQYIKFISLPSQLSAVYTGARISLGMAWMSIVASEMISSQSGLGYLIQLHRIDLDYTSIFLDIFLIAISGYLMNLFLQILERRHIVWKS